MILAAIVLGLLAAGGAGGLAARAWQRRQRRAAIARELADLAAATGTRQQTLKAIVEQYRPR